MGFEEGLKAMFHYWHPPLCSCQLPVNIHTWGHVVREKKGRTYYQNKTTTSIFIHDKQPIDEDNKANIQLKIYTLQKNETLGSVSPCQFRYLTRKSKVRNSSLRHRQLQPSLTLPSLTNQVFLIPNFFFLIVTLSVPSEGYCRNAYMMWSFWCDCSLF